MNPTLQLEGLRLQKKLQQKSLESLQKELNKQIAEKIAASMEAIPLFCRELEQFGSWSAAHPVIWKEGSTELYEYKSEGLRAKGKGRGEEAPVLIIPSLINRHYILDLAEGNSFVKYIAGKGFDTYLASWGEPLEDELEFSLDEYIARIEAMIDLLHKKTGKKIVLAGYCMGGLLALAAAQGRIAKIKSLAFLATPWDFHEETFPRFALAKEHVNEVENLMDNSAKVPAAFVQAIFYYLHFHLVGQKFKIYPMGDSKNHTRAGFLAVENWANDGISMTRLVAKECFLGWVHNNNVAKLKWKIRGKIVSPKPLGKLPAFFAIPSKDSVVPPNCAMPLTKYFKTCEIINPDVGHVGMVVGNSAKSQTWEPFVRWLGKGSI